VTGRVPRLTPADPPVHLSDSDEGWGEIGSNESVDDYNGDFDAYDNDDLAKAIVLAKKNNVQRQAQQLLQRIDSEEALHGQLAPLLHLLDDNHIDLDHAIAALKREHDQRRREPKAPPVIEALSEL
jgi:hypothetical protein